MGDARSCCGDLRQQFRRTNFGLDHDEPDLFVKAQCFRSPAYLVWSGFWAVFHVSMALLDAHYRAGDGAAWLVYLTNWTYTLQTATVLLDFAVTAYVHWKRKDIVNGERTETPWYVKVEWTLFNVLYAASVLVTLLYYLLLQPEWSHGSINKHLLNSVYTLASLMFSAKPVRLLHVFHPIIYTAVYIVFSIIYHVSGGGAIYDPLNWDNVGSTVGLALAVGLVGVPITHLFCFALYTLRLYIASKCCVMKEKRSKSSMQREITPRDVELSEVAGHE